MPNLKELKTRLDELPKMKAEAHLAATFSKYCQSVRQARQDLEATYVEMGYAGKVNSNPEYQRKVLPELKKAMRVAKGLHRSIEESAEKVTSRATENRVADLRDYAKRAKTQCHAIWIREVEGSADRWEKLADVIESLGAKGGNDLKQTIENLRRQRIPESDAEVERVRSALDRLQKGIKNLGLEGSFGRFLKASSEGGASPKDLLTDEVKIKMDEHELWDSFRVIIER